MSPFEPLSPDSPSVGAWPGDSEGGLTGVSGAINGLAVAGFLDLAVFFRVTAFFAAFFLGAAVFRAVFFRAVFFAAFFFGADLRTDLRADLRVVLRPTFLRAVFLRAILAFDFTRAFLDFAAFFPARFFVAFLAAIFTPPVGPVCRERESRIAGIQNSLVVFGKTDSRSQR